MLLRITRNSPDPSTTTIAVSSPFSMKSTILTRMLRCSTKKQSYNRASSDTGATGFMAAAAFESGISAAEELKLLNVQA